MFKTSFFYAFIFFALLSYAQVQIPKIHSNMYKDNAGRLYIKVDTEAYFEAERPAKYTLNQFKQGISGSDDGLNFDFGSGFNGTLYYGFIHYFDSKHPMPVIFKTPAKIVNGKAAIKIKGVLSGRYDMIGWEKAGKGTLGYRVATDKGEIIYDGIISFKGTGPFSIDTTILEGPFVNRLSSNSAVISFETNVPIIASLEINEGIFKSEKETTHHEIMINNLKPATQYSYTVIYGDNKQSYALKTAPEQGSRSEFTFAYASDSRAGQGGGERNVHGTNYYIMRKIMALNAHQQIAFMQFSGDLINGYLQSRGRMDLQYANWKRAIEPFAHYFPVYKSMGNHEALTRSFDNNTARGITVDRFPYKNKSAEKAFADNFVNPENGPQSEDGSVYDPDKNQVDFPSYSENVFYYTYDNVAVIVLNSDYWYAPSRDAIPYVSGGLHGYIMDNQLKWLTQTVAELEADRNIDHVFITLHTPFFPNGGHVGDDMWYNGDNSKRPYIAGKAVEYGIIERRDQLLDIIVNKSKKVAAIFTGDEHNYNRLEIGPNTPIYPADYSKKKIKLSRKILQINNGAAGAPYYAQQKVPWTDFVSSFTTQNAVVYFKVNGKKIIVEVHNPDTLEKFDHFELPI